MNMQSLRLKVFYNKASYNSIKQFAAIALRGRYDLRMNPRKAIVEASEVLDENVIKNLLNNVPNSNKLQELESYTKEDFSKFTETELFVWRVSLCIKVDFSYGG